MKEIGKRQFYYGLAFLTVCLFLSAAYVSIAEFGDWKNRELSHFENRSLQQINDDLIGLREDWRMTASSVYNISNVQELLGRGIRLYGAVRKLDERSLFRGYLAYDPNAQLRKHVQELCDSFNRQLAGYLYNSSNQLPDTKSAFRYYYPETFNRDRVIGWWVAFFLGSLGLYLLHCWRDLTDQKASFALAFVDWRLYAYGLVPWYGLFRYPRQTSIRQQLTQLAEVAVWFVMAAVSVAGGGLAKAQQRDDGSNKRSGNKTWVLGGSVETLGLNKYQGLDGGTFHDGAVLQTNVELKLKGGCSVGFWSSNALTRGTGNFGTEFDYSAGCSRTFRGSNVSASFVHLDVYPLGTTRGDVQQVHLRVARRFGLGRGQSVTPFWWSWLAWPVRGPTPDGGLFIHGGATHELRLGRLTLATTPEVLRDVSGAFGYRKATIGKVTNRWSWRLNRSASLVLPYLRLVQPFGDPRDGRKTDLQFGLGLSYSF